MSSDDKLAWGIALDVDLLAQPDNDDLGVAHRVAAYLRTADGIKLLSGDETIREGVTEAAWEIHRRERDAAKPAPHKYESGGKWANECKCGEWMGDRKVHPYD